MCTPKKYAFIVEINKYKKSVKSSTEQFPLLALGEEIRGGITPGKCVYYFRLLVFGLFFLLIRKDLLYLQVKG